MFVDVLFRVIQFPVQSHVRCLSALEYLKDVWFLEGSQKVVPNIPLGSVSKS